MNTTPSYYIIAYDLNKPRKDYPGLEEQINKFAAQCWILESTWIVKTRHTSAEIKKLLSAADRNDGVFIAKIDIDSCAGRLNDDARKWINAQIDAG